MHQVKPAHVGLGDWCSLDGARIVDHDVEAAEGRNGLVEGSLDLSLVAYIDRKRQRVAAGPGDLLRGSEDRARQLGMRLVGLRGDGNIGPVPRGA